ncbi:neutral/alkaline non-lysosomal ceramidase N-terminal domain-containing protein [Amnibacterium sp. CER49]|nr:neutral/alkaline non-lysosomal ceramidase N-terminal domain-containing protein [Amnibacterium sp. CER49]MDH2442849.1 neutral/alkaline non-lysosomal ceramidase N-terminal domain-containing protein [Amnibacterium sp. CER49]
MSEPGEWRPPSSRLASGVARADITPPVGTPTRNWAAARSQVSSGVHRPLTVTVWAIVAGDGSRGAVVSLDLGWWRTGADERRVRERVLSASGLSDLELLLHLTHTHAGPYLHPEPDSEAATLVEDYLNGLADTVASTVREAFAGAVPSVVTWGRGWCGLAVNRDLPAGDREVIAFNPNREADGTVVVGRVTDSDGGVLAVIVNYACHPTTLSYPNTLTSPDWVGAAREVVEQASGAPCLFLQGASGDQSPRDQATGDTAVADANGRQLGHAVLSVLHGLPAPAARLMRDGVVESGAPLGLWASAPFAPDPTVRFSREEIDLELASARVPDTDDVVTRERALRKSLLSAEYVRDGRGVHPLWVWRLGDAAIVAHPGEAYSAFQRSLREAHSDQAVVVMNCTNGPGFVYLPAASDYRTQKYPVWQTLVGPGSLERLTDAAARRLDAVFASDEVTGAQ